MFYKQVFKILLLALTTLSVIHAINYTFVDAQAGRLVFAMDDPLGDDDGPGTYIYPSNSVFVNGAFDLRRFEVWELNDSIMFKVKVDQLGDNPWNGANGFSLQYIQIYVYTNSSYPVRHDTYGLNVEVQPGWHFAILVNGGWGDTPLPDGELPVIYYSNGNMVVEGPLFRVYVDEADNSIVAEINKTALFDLEHIDEWGYAVFVTSYDGYSENGYRVREVQVEASEWNIGGGDSEAIQAGVQPRVMDLLANTSDEQYSMLTSYDPVNKKLAVVNMVFPHRATTTQPTTSPTTTPTSTPPSQSTPRSTPRTTSTPRTSSSTPPQESTPTSTPTPTPTVNKPPIEIKSPSPRSEGVSSTALLIVYLALIAAALIVIVVVIKAFKG